MQIETLSNGPDQWLSIQLTTREQNPHIFEHMDRRYISSSAIRKHAAGLAGAAHGANLKTSTTNVQKSQNQYCTQLKY